MDNAYDNLESDIANAKKKIGSFRRWSGCCVWSFLVLAITTLLVTYFCTKDWQRIGATLVAVSAGLAAIHFYIYFTTVEFFQTIDPAFGSVHMKRLERRADGEENSRYGLSKLTAECHDISAKYFKRILVTEMLLIVVGTILNGYGDWF